MRKQGPNNNSTRGSREHVARQEGMEKGMEKGLVKGMEKGLAKGMEKRPNRRHRKGSRKDHITAFKSQYEC